MTVKVTLNHLIYYVILYKNPREGIGKPERLKYFEEEVYSHRLNQKDRMIYTIYEEVKEIDVSSFRGHYE